MAAITAAKSVTIAMPQSSNARTVSRWASAPAVKQPMKTTAMIAYRLRRRLSSSSGLSGAVVITAGLFDPTWRGMRQLSHRSAPSSPVWHLGRCRRAPHRKRIGYQRGLRGGPIGRDNPRLGEPPYQGGPTLRAGFNPVRSDESRTPHLRRGWPGDTRVQIEPSLLSMVGGLAPAGGVWPVLAGVKVVPARARWRARAGLQLDSGCALAG